MVRAIVVSILSVCSIGLPLRSPQSDAIALFASTALAQVPEDHRGSGRCSENPTIPGDGTPGRTQGSATR